MTAPNGYVNGAGSHNHGAAEHSIHAVDFPSEKTRELIAELEVPFASSVIEWRVTNTSKDKKRGQVIPYADQRAYTDRLNALFTPGGWTRKYAVHTSPNFQCDKDQKTVAKVFVTCEMTIFGIGTHSAVGEEWAGDENAGTSAEAQAFKRACSCFGLGRYLYHFEGVWVDLDERKRPRQMPHLAGWATPEGWRQGLRPTTLAVGTEPTTSNAQNGRIHPKQSAPECEMNSALIREIEQMQDTLGTHMYRGLLRLAKAWKPTQIQDVNVQRKTLERMQSAARGFRRLEAALENVSEETLTQILKSLKIRSIERIDNLETLHQLVLELEAKASPKK